MKTHEKAPVLEIERTPEFYEVATALSDYVNALNLDAGRNNELVRLMLDQVKEAEMGAFSHGFRLGVAYKDLELKDDERAAAAPVLGGGVPS